MLEVLLQFASCLNSSHCRLFVDFLGQIGEMLTHYGMADIYHDSLVKQPNAVVNQSVVNRQTDRLIDRQTDRHTESDRSTDRLTDKATAWLVNRETDRPVERQTDQSLDWSTDRQTDRPVERQTDQSLDWSTRQTDRQQMLQLSLLLVALKIDLAIQHFVVFNILLQLSVIGYYRFAGVL